jgi:hypothetical protein
MHSGEQGTEWRIGNVPSRRELDIRKSRTRAFRPYSVVKTPKKLKSEVFRLMKLPYKKF